MLWSASCCAVGDPAQAAVQCRLLHTLPLVTVWVYGWWPPSWCSALLCSHVIPLTSWEQQAVADTDSVRVSHRVLCMSNNTVLLWAILCSKCDCAQALKHHPHQSCLERPPAPGQVCFQQPRASNCMDGSGVDGNDGSYGCFLLACCWGVAALLCESLLPHWMTVCVVSCCLT